MANLLIQYFLDRTDLKKNEVTAIQNSMIELNFNRGDVIAKEGDFNSNTYFVLKGLVRQFKLIDGNEITTHFFSEGQWIIYLENFQNRKPSQRTLICVEDTTVVVGNEEKAQALFKQFPNFETISRQVMESVFREQQLLLESYITDKPEQRYLKLLQNRPDIFQRVPQYDIASYIGVKPESLSRIRKKLAGK